MKVTMMDDVWWRNLRRVIKMDVLYPSSVWQSVHHWLSITYELLQDVLQDFQGIRTDQYIRSKVNTKYELDGASQSVGVTSIATPPPPSSPPSSPLSWSPPSPQLLFFMVYLLIIFSILTSASPSPPLLFVFSWIFLVSPVQSGTEWSDLILTRHYCFPPFSSHPLPSRPIPTHPLPPPLLNSPPLYSLPLPSPILPTTPFPDSASTYLLLTLQSHPLPLHPVPSHPCPFKTLHLPSLPFPSPFSLLPGNWRSISHPQSPLQSLLSLFFSLRHSTLLLPFLPFLTFLPLTVYHRIALTSPFFPFSSADTASPFTTFSHILLHHLFTFTCPALLQFPSFHLMSSSIHLHSFYPLFTFFPILF